MKLFKVRQHLKSTPLANIPQAVNAALDAANIQVPKGDVAITAGSRGIANIAAITRAAGDWLKQKGAKPYVVPCMGSHNGASARGQKEMAASLGITEAAMDMAIRSSMAVVKLGTVASGDVFMDRFCHEASGVLVLNRIKLHTAFSGPLQSGLVKMMVVGMGKIRSAQTFHNTPQDQMAGMLAEMGQLMVDTGKITAGLAILEDGLDQTAELHAMPGNRILEEEPRLLKRHQAYFPRLPVDHLNVLVVDEMGKTYSGTGMDTNVIGYRGIRHFEDLEKPKINVIAVLNLAAASQGNAIGVGLADVITRRLRDAIDEEKTLINVLTTGEMGRARIPATLADDAAVITRLTGRFGTNRWMFIPNTLHLDTLYISEDLVSEVAAHPLCEVAPEPVTLAFDNGCLQLAF